MALEHLIVHKSSDYLCAFPDLIRRHNRHSYRNQS